MGKLWTSDGKRTDAYVAGCTRAEQASDVPTVPRTNGALCHPHCTFVYLSGPSLDREETPFPPNPDRHSRAFLSDGFHSNSPTVWSIFFVASPSYVLPPREVECGEAEDVPTCRRRGRFDAWTMRTSNTCTNATPDGKVRGTNDAKHRVGRRQMLRTGSGVAMGQIAVVAWPGVAWSVVACARSTTSPRTLLPGRSIRWGRRRSTLFSSNLSLPVGIKPPAAPPVDECDSH